MVDDGDGRLSEIEVLNGTFKKTVCDNRDAGFRRNTSFRLGSGGVRVGKHTVLRLSPQVNAAKIVLRISLA